MDIADQAQRFERINLEQSLKVQRETSQYTPKHAPAGHCLNLECGEPFDDVSTRRLYCGPECADRHDKQLRLMNQRKSFT